MRSPTLVFATACLVLLWSQPGHATDMAGITLGQPVHLDECPQRQGDYLPDDRSTCFKLPGGPSRDPYADAATPPHDGRIIINVALPDRPDYMHGSDAVVQLRGGVAVSIALQTHGFSEQSRDFRALEDVYGDTSPRYLATTWSAGPGLPMQSQTSMRADWTLPDNETVYFNSTEFGRFNGLVRVQTSAAPAHQNGTWD